MNAGLNNLAIVFTDIIEGTRLNNELGDAEWDRIRSACFARARQTLAEHNGWIASNGSCYRLRHRVSTRGRWPSNLGLAAVGLDESGRRDRQISERGVGGTLFAVADFDGDGLDGAASLHPSILYLFIGTTLVSVGTPREAAEGHVLWQLQLAVQTGPPSLAALATNGELSIVLAGSDGFVCAIR